VAVRLRMKRMGRRHHAAFRLTAVDRRSPRDSKVIEELGFYHPVNPNADQQFVVNRERVEYWLGVGALPSDTVRQLLKKQGIGQASS